MSLIYRHPLTASLRSAPSPQGERANNISSRKYNVC
jgi:hypothetical protein